MTPTDTELERLAKAATPGPWRAHDHRDMVRVGENPDEWIGYAWVGHKGEEDGRFQAKIADLDARNDASEEWRKQKAKDAAFIAAFNPTVALDLLTRLRAAEREREEIIVGPWLELEELARKIVGCGRLVTVEHLQAEAAAILDRSLEARK